MDDKKAAVAAVAAVAAMLSDMDSGSTSYVLDTALSDFKRQQQQQQHSLSSSTSSYKNLLLPFTGQMKAKMGALTPLIDKVQDAIKDNLLLRGKLVDYSTALWIHHTLQIEHENLPQEADTLKVVQSRKLFAQDPPKAQYVIDMLEVLEQTYSDSPQLCDRRMETKQLLNWHIGLMKSTNKQETGTGAFRTRGVQTYSGSSSSSSSSSDDSQTHVYPHHSIITAALNKLGYIVYKLAKEIEAIQSLQQRVLYTFALASFAQFHFVDIHPFLDGNGRMCRFICKYLLDAVLPLPFPMYTNRENYLGTLVVARTKDALSAPAGLFELSINECTLFYLDLVKVHLKAIPGRIINARTEKELLELIQDTTDLNSSSASSDKLMQEFRKLQEGQQINIDLHCCTIVLIRDIDIEQI